MLRRMSVVVLVVVGLVAGAAVNASAATVSPSTWAPKFCGTIDQYETTLSKGAENLNTSLAGTTKLTNARTQLVAFLGKMQAAAKTATSKMQAAGVPSSANGAQIAGKFVSALDASVGAFAKAKSAVTKVSTSSPAAFKKQATKVGTDLSKAGDRLSSTFDHIASLDSKGELASALQAEPTCSFLANGGSSSGS
jgi:hypothetical protein